MNASLKTRKNVVTFFTYLVLILGSISMIFPFVWMVLTSFKTQAESMAIPPQILPSHWNLDSFVKALQEPALYQPLHQYGSIDPVPRDFCGGVQLHGGLCLCQTGIPLQKTAVQSGADPDDAAEPDLHYSAVPDAGKDGGHQLHLRAGVPRSGQCLRHLLFAAGVSGHPQRDRRGGVSGRAATSGRLSSRSCCR